MKAYGGVDVESHIFLTSPLAGSEWSASRPGSIIPGKKSPRYPLDRKFGAPNMDMEEILDPTGTRTPTPRSSST
jgi:hypothetical protein